MEHHSESNRNLKYSSHSRDIYDKEASRYYRKRSRSKSRSLSYRKAAKDNHKSDYKTLSKHQANQRSSDYHHKESSKYRKDSYRNAKSRSNSYSKQKKSDYTKSDVKQSPLRKERKR